MLVIMDSHANEKEIHAVLERIKALGYTPHQIPGVSRVAIGVTGNKDSQGKLQLEIMPGVSQVMIVTKPYKLASREVHPENTVIKVGEAVFGDDSVVMIAGPCAVENEETTVRIAQKALPERPFRPGPEKFLPKLPIFWLIESDRYPEMTRRNAAQIECHLRR